MSLVAGDKSGRWETWYRQAIPVADARFDEHLIVLKARQDQEISEPDRRAGRQRPKEGQ